MEFVRGNVLVLESVVIGLFVSKLIAIEKTILPYMPSLNLKAFS